jgi:hypothetical protein
LVTIKLRIKKGRNFFYRCGILTRKVNGFVATPGKTSLPLHTETGSMYLIFPVFGLLRQFSLHLSKKRGVGLAYFEINTK